PPSTGILVPFTYAAAGLARKAATAAISSGSANRPSGISCNISASTSALGAFALAVLLSIIVLSRAVAVAPGKTLFTVRPYAPSSLESVLAQDATAPRMVLLTPRPFKGIFTEVEIILMIRP